MQMHDTDFHVNTVIDALTNPTRIHVIHVPICLSNKDQ